MQLQFPDFVLGRLCATQQTETRRHMHYCERLRDRNGLAAQYRIAYARTRGFFDQAQLIFESLLSDRLDWKILYAFFTNTTYSSRVVALDDEAEHDDEEEQEDALPPTTLRFDLRVQPYDELVRRQRARNSTASHLRSAADIALASDHMELHVENGFGHYTEFPYDVCEPEYRNKILRRAAIDGGWTFQTSLEVVEEWYREEGLASPPPAEEQGAEPGVGSNKDPLADKGAPADKDPPGDEDLSDDEDPAGKIKPSLPPLQIDYFDVSENFNQCDHFRKSIAKLLASATIKAMPADPPVAQALGSQVASLHILQKLRAMNKGF